MPPVSGSVRFEQGDGNPLGDVTVTVSLRGIMPGLHGFHVHQFGDVRSLANFDTMGYHFVPMCNPPDMVVGPDGALAPTDGGCKDDQVHGLPPSQRRQPGDMGNIQAVGADGSVEVTLTIGQQKMSLSDPLRSVVGRVVVVHKLVDDGLQPYGNAGGPEAYGVIGIGRTGSGTGDDNNAKAPLLPKVTRAICVFEQRAEDPQQPQLEPPASGSVLLTLLEPQQPDTVHVQARLFGLEPSSEHSFHFHTFGDMTVGFTELGQIYSSAAINIEHLSVNSRRVAMLDSEYSADTLAQHVGRSLTIHSGRTASSPTIAAAVCGVANPHAVMSTQQASAEHASSSGVGVGVIVLVAFASLVSLSTIAICLAYYLGLPLSCCDRVCPCLAPRKESRYVSHTGAASPQPPPPPPPLRDIPPSRSKEPPRVHQKLSEHV